MGGKMPNDHWEKSPGDLNAGDNKYASRSTMENPQDLKKSNDALVGYVKSHKMKY